MKFIDRTHEQAYSRLLYQMGVDDTYHAALAYLITLDSDCSSHVSSIYDFENGCIIPECLADSWQTSTTLKTCRLAFNLYTDSLLWCEDDAKKYCTPAELFCCSYAPYYWQAIQIRYPEYTEE